MIPRAIRSWTLIEEGEKLQELAKDKTCLELGAWIGFTTICMAWTAKIVYSVDVHTGTEETGKRDTFPLYFENLVHYHVVHKVAMFVGETEQILPRLPRNYFDLAFIDANHSYESVRQDITLTLPLMNSKGIIAFHDYFPTHPGVVKAVDEFIAKEQIKPIECVKELLVCQA